MKIPPPIYRLTNFILAACLLLTLILIAITFHFNGLYGQDGHEYLRLARALNEYFENGTPIPHSYFPIFYPLVGLLVSKIGLNDIITLQLIAMFSLVGSFFYLKKLIQLVYAEAKFLNSYLIVFFFLSPYIFRFGLLAMSDMFCLLLVIASVYHAIRYSCLLLRRDAVLAAFFSACAVETRYAVIMILFFTAFIVIKTMAANNDWKTTWICLPAFIVALLPDWIIRSRLMFFDVSNGNFAIDYSTNAYSWSPVNFFQNIFQNPDGYQHYDVWNIAAATFNIIHPAFLFAGIVFVFFLKRKDFASPAVRILLVMVIGYGLFIAGLHYQNNRYLLQSFPFVLVIFYPVFVRSTAQFFSKTEIQMAAFAVTVIVQMSLFWYSFQDIYLMNHTEKEIAASLKPYSGQTLYTCSISGALASYHVENPVVDLYFNRVQQVVPHSLLLFNYNVFSEHFKEDNPMLNWQWLNDHYHLNIVQSFPGGWALFTIEPGSRE